MLYVYSGDVGIARRQEAPSSGSGGQRHGLFVVWLDDGSVGKVKEARDIYQSKKGKSRGMVMKESEGYLHGEQLKAIGEDVLYGKKIK